MKHPLKPNLFIIGAPKCGTTALAHWLSGHPDVFFSDLKEPSFFNHDFAQRAITRLNDYESLFRKANPDHKAIGEASVRYLFSNVAVPGILEYNSDARFVVMLRVPTDMVRAIHEQRLFGFSENIPDFKKAWRMQRERLRGHFIPPRCQDPCLLQYGEWGRLGFQVERLLKHVDADRCHFILLDDVRSDARRAWLDLLAFLGLPDDGRSAFPVMNPAKTRRFSTLALLAHALGNTKRRLVGRSFSLGILNTMNRMTRMNRPRPDIDAAFSEELKRFFASDVVLLEQCIGRDLSAWR